MTKICLLIVAVLALSTSCVEARGSSKPAGDVGAPAGYGGSGSGLERGLHRQSSNLRGRESFLIQQKARLDGGLAGF
jgi:hypothetical protein